MVVYNELNTTVLNDSEVPWVKLLHKYDFLEKFGLELGLELD